MKIAPKTSGQSEPRPPTTTPTSRKIESVIGYVSGLTKVVAIASSEPATPGVEGADPERERLVGGEVDPGGGRGQLAVADGAERTAALAAQQQPGNGEHEQCDPPAQVVEPLVEARDLEPEELDRLRDRLEGDRIGRLDRARAGGRLEQVDPAAAARELLEAVVLDQPRHRDRDRERREREVEACQPQCGEAEGEADRGLRRARPAGSSRRPSRRPRRCGRRASGPSRRRGSRSCSRRSP